MKRGDHICLIYDDKGEWLDAVSSFIRDGLKRGERCIYITDEHGADDVRMVLKDSIPDMDSADARGQFIIKDSSVYAPGGVFDPEGMIGLLESEVRRALGDGFSGLRVTGEATWTLRDVKGSERIIEYEIMLRDFFRENECIALCQYHRPRFSPETLKGVLLSHPLIVWKSRVHWNPYHVDHENFTGGVSGELEVETWLRNIERENELLRNIENLEYIFEIFIDNNPSIVFLKDSELRYVLVNRKFCESIGMELGDITGKTDYEIMDLESASISRESDIAALKRGSYHSEDLIGGRIYEVNKFSLELPDGSRGVGGYAVDVTRRRMYEDELRSSRNNFMGVVEGSPDPLLIVDSQGRVLYFNAAAGDYLSMGPSSTGELVGVPLKEDVQEINIMSPDGSLRTAEMSVTPVKWEGEDARLIRLHDITRMREYEMSLSESLREKEVMLREIHHRVKNNLQIISSLLNLQKYFIDDEKLVEVFNDSVNRIKSMAMIHEKLYQSESLAYLPFSDYIMDLVSEVRSNYPEKRISVSYDMGEVHLDINRAIPAGLIVNEAVTNAMKYAFTDGGELTIRLHSADGCVRLEVEDNGPGLPPGFDPTSHGGLGMELMRNLAGQLGGELKIEGDDGVVVSLVFPIAE